MKIVIDAMGGDNAPEAVVQGAVLAKREYGCEIVLVGDKAAIENILKQEDAMNDGIEVVHSSEVISNNESPTEAIRKKKDSSMVVGLNLLKDEKADAFISAGSTGALLAGGTFIVKRIPGVIRPALAPVVPSKKGSFLLLDSGANAECKPQHLEQFAYMGSVYASKVLKKENPVVGIVNIGTEEEKGSKLVKESSQLIKNLGINFMGSIEARDIPSGTADVVVCDGFTGNVVLKLYEGMVETIFSILKKKMLETTRTKIGALLLKPVFKAFKKDYDYTEYGGAILLGLNKPVIKAHGSSNAKAIKNAVRQAINYVQANVVDEIKADITAHQEN